VTEPVTITLLGRPVPSNRAPRGPNGFLFVPKRQTDAVAAIRVAASDAMQGRSPLQGPLAITFLAEMPIPASWPKRKQQAAMLNHIWPITKPDLKNLFALAEDALKTVVYHDDCIVCRHSTEKRYGAQAKIIITVSPI